MVKQAKAGCFVYFLCVETLNKMNQCTNCVYTYLGMVNKDADTGELDKGKTALLHTQISLAISNFDMNYLSNPVVTNKTLTADKSKRSFGRSGFKSKFRFTRIG